MSASSQLKKYSEYIDSGVSWLGDIPSVWGVKKVKYLCKIGRGRVISKQ